MRRNVRTAPETTRLNGALAGDSPAGQLAPDDLAAGVLGLDTPTVGEVLDQLKASVPRRRVDVWCERRRAAVACLDANATNARGDRQLDRSLRVTCRVGDELCDHELGMEHRVLASPRKTQLVLDEAPRLDRATQFAGESHFPHVRLRTPHKRPQKRRRARPRPAWAEGAGRTRWPEATNVPMIRVSSDESTHPPCR